MDILPEPTELSEAIFYAVAYADIFDQPVPVKALHRFLPYIPVPSVDLQRALQNGAPAAGQVERHGDWLTLRGRSGLIAAQASKLEASRAALRPALEYGARLGSFPFVRMVALTGALAVQNGSPGSDFDYLVVARSGRIWTCRLLILVLVRLAALQGHTLCPNFIMAENSLILSDRTLFTARELAQMVPITGLDVYAELRRANAWADRLLPNAHGPPDGIEAQDVKPSGWSRLLEKLLAGRSGDQLERWERERKTARFSEAPGLTQETQFTTDRIQGHFGGYRRKTMEAFMERLERLRK